MKDLHRQNCDWKYATLSYDVDDQTITTECRTLSWNRWSCESTANGAEYRDGVGKGQRNTDERHNRIEADNWAKVEAGEDKCKCHRCPDRSSGRLQVPYLHVHSSAAREDTLDLTYRLQEASKWNTTISCKRPKLPRSGSDLVDQSRKEC